MYDFLAKPFLHFIGKLNSIYISITDAIRLSRALIYSGWLETRFSVCGSATQVKDMFTHSFAAGNS